MSHMRAFNLKFSIYIDYARSSSLVLRVMWSAAYEGLPHARDLLLDGRDSSVAHR
jgi:hypothetical protein